MNCVVQEPCGRLGKKTGKGMKEEKSCMWK